MAEFSADKMRARFHELAALKAKQLTVSGPIREKYDAKRNEISELERTQLKPLIAKMQEAEKGLYEISQEMALLARALSGKTGEPPAKAA